MKSVVRSLALVMFAVSFHSAHAQGVSQTPQKRVVKIDDSTGDLVEVPQAAPAQTVAAPSPIVILNSQNQKTAQTTAQLTGQTAIQEQPTSVIEDSPLSMSSAERRRRDRQALELQTESKIVEKLEEARIEDERKRADRLFKNSFNAAESTPAPAPVVQPLVAQPPVYVAPAPVVVEQKPVDSKVEAKEEPKVNVKEEVRAALEEMKPKSDTNKPEYYMQGLVGIGSYPDAVNVRGNGSAGFSLGMVTPERIVAEGTFQFSQYDIETMQAGYAYNTPPFKTLSQYNFTGAIKYQLMSGKVRPLIGALAGYTYRSYKDQQTYYAYYASSDVSTNAFDVGALVGLDVQLTNSFSIGFDMRYMKNVAYRENSDYQRSFVYPRAGKAVEELDYYMGSLVGRFAF